MLKWCEHEDQVIWHERFRASRAFASQRSPGGRVGGGGYADGRSFDWLGGGCCGEGGCRHWTDAYVYGYPLVTMEMTRRVMTNGERPEGNRGPMGKFIRARAYRDAKFRDVTAPNADTLYTTAWINVAKEPRVVAIPDAKDRYYLLPMLSGWTDVFQVAGKPSGPPCRRSHR